MDKKLLPLFLIISMTLLAHNVRSQSFDSNWTHFRGSMLDGIAEKSTIPLIWNDSTNVLWKTPIQNDGWSSPVVYNDQIWTTTATADGKKMYAICLDAMTGQLIHNILLFEPDTVYGKHSINSYATPTPCIESGFVYISFGRYGTACLDTQTGETVWKRNDLICTHVQGPGSSPIIYKNKLIVHIEGNQNQLIYALDKVTGEIIWAAQRPQDIYKDLTPVCRIAYITPIIVNVNGQDQLISNGSAVCSAYNPETGEEIWRIVKGENATIAMPVEEDGIIYYYAGFITTPDGEKYSELVAVNPNGRGEISETNILWSIKAPILQLLTPIIKEGLIYTVDSKNIMQCIDAKTGDIIWSEKIKEKFNASPVWANGHLYFPSVRGNTTVIKEGREFVVVTENQLEGQIWSTPAVYDNSIIIRTSKYIYRIGKVSDQLVLSE